MNASQGIAHSSVAPSNPPQIADFGLAHVMPPDSTSIRTQTYGTVTHMPPELLNDSLLSKATDVYSFGVILWELYCGHRPYAGMSHGQIIHQITSGKALELPNKSPPGLKELVAQCMASDHQQRPTFADILKKLAALEKQLLG